MKTLIINGSPRPDGDTAVLIKELKSRLEGEVVELSAYRANIAPCVDCRRCWTATPKCVVKDDMKVIYDDDFDNVVLASPVYFMTLPGQVLNLMSRMQPWHVATHFNKKPLKQRRKKAAVLLTAGGKGNADGAEHHIRTLFKLLNAIGYEEHMVKSLHTDTISASMDTIARARARMLADWLNEPLPPEPVEEKKPAPKPAGCSGGSCNPSTCGCGTTCTSCGG